ncbi:hypothetical protein ACFVHB_00445 [Kitasatospora sp. NPDC127111]|uniref:hypothetical protein n=1 Tax=Kitasatospora sp. NPDC127111 TaxID=3345363 RepID=UPI00363B4A31
MSVDGGAGLLGRWSAILGAVKERRRFTWILLAQNATPTSFDESKLILQIASDSARDSFLNSGGIEILQQSVQAVTGYLPEVLLATHGSPVAESPSEATVESAMEAGEAVQQPVGSPLSPQMEKILAQTAFLMHEQGKSQAAALLLDVEGVELAPGNSFGDYEEAHLVVPPFLVPRFTDAMLESIAPVFERVAYRNGLEDVHGISVIPALPSIGSDWRQELQRRLAGGAVSNQAIRSRSRAVKPAIMRDGCVFDSLEEVRVYEALKRAQAVLPPDATISIFPLPAGRVGAGNTWTPDFLVARGGRVGIIEVDGPQHSGRRAADSTRDRHWRNSGIVHIERILVEETSDDAELDKLVQVFLKRLREH